jgi:hypothetical protein
MHHGADYFRLAGSVRQQLVLLSIEYRLAERVGFERSHDLVEMRDDRIINHAEEHQRRAGAQQFQELRRLLELVVPAAARRTGRVFRSKSPRP